MNRVDRSFRKRQSISGLWKANTKIATTYHNYSAVKHTGGLDATGKGSSQRLSLLEYSSKMYNTEIRGLESDEKAKQHNVHYFP